ncbi:2-oxoglutarate dehydrogenase [Diplonema papillatum]|nr:2-oxoglutarate dehydrogenase [Diplonema papillatum]
MLSRLGRRGLARTMGRTMAGVPERMPLHKLDSIFAGVNGDYLDVMYEQFTDDPQSVSEELQHLFKECEDTAREFGVIGENLRPISPLISHKASRSTPRTVLHALRVGWMLRLWAVRGHRLADLDPLGIANKEGEEDRNPSSSKVSAGGSMFHPTAFGFTEEDMDQVIHLAVSDKIGGLLALDQEPMTIRTLYAKLVEIYAGKVGWEYMHIPDAQRLLWLKKRIETPNAPRVHIDYKDVFYWLARAENFEQFLQKKFSNVKRFGIDGCEVLIPALKELLEKSSDLGVENVILGMPHRGRLNVLANIAGKPMGSIFGEFQGSGGTEELEFGSGDVKYHLGFSEKSEMKNGKTLSISLVANPSHLEAVNPVVQGKCKAKQLFIGDTKSERTMSILMHGDASFAGQGVCFEAMGLNDLEAYKVGGTVHVVVNNQIGFTTDPAASRSTPYCTDLGKMFNAPVFHVNGDAIHDVIRVFRLAAEYRAEYKSDVVIDVICYRRYGHNESDEPSFTQPRMYKKIADHPTQLTIYGDKLVAEGLMTRAEVNAGIASINDEFRDEFKSLAAYEHKGRSHRAEWLESFWTGFKSPTQLAKILPTAKEADVLQSLGRAINTIPSRIQMHPVVSRIIENRLNTIESGEGIDWPTAEALAFATLLEEGNHVRLSGQDVERGTFSQRHSMIHDVETGEKFFPIGSLETNTATATIINSSLSEFGVLGFEVGFGSESPNQLVLWEAQFGDFANTAQVIFDQFLSAGEVKWFRQNGLVVNLPHGYDGQGPEHSSGRLERFLQMTVEPESNPHIDEVVALQKCNWQVCYPTTPAQYFHLLRRQVHRDFRKPLILFFAKSTLRAPNVSSLSELATPSEFQVVIPEGDERVVPDQVRRVIFCSGQVYFHLRNTRDKTEAFDIALVRIEQLSPFPWEKVQDEMDRYPKAAALQWCQEEPKNMGSWTFIEPRMNSMLEEAEDSREMAYNGRKPAAAPATGLVQLHEMEHAEILDAAFI